MKGEALDYWYELGNLPHCKMLLGPVLLRVMIDPD